MLMLRALILLALMLALSPNIAVAQSATSQKQVPNLEDLLAERARQRDELVELMVVVPNEDGLASVIAELIGGFSQDPVLTKRLVSMLEEDLSSGGTSLPAPARDAALEILSATGDEAWDPALVERGNKVAAHYADRRDEFLERTARLSIALSVRLEALSDTRAYFGTIKDTAPSSTEFVDLEFLVCPTAAADLEAVRAVRAIAEMLAQQGFGRVRLTRATEAMIEETGVKTGMALVIFDADHSEVNELDRLKMLLSETDLPPATLTPNAGEPTYWLLSVLVCPETKDALLPATVKGCDLTELGPAGPLTLSNHRIPEIAFCPTPNKSGRLADGVAQFVVLNSARSPGLTPAVNWLTNPSARASSHIVIGRDGTAVQLADLNEKTWHAGQSRWKGIHGLNSHAIGIAMVNWLELKGEEGAWSSWSGESVEDDEVIRAEHQHRPGTLSGWQTYTAAQIETLVRILRLIAKAYGIAAEDVIGHDDVSPARKLDPGPAFPWERVRAELEGG